MNCLKCNEILAEKAVFCHKCGAKQMEQNQQKKSRVRGNGTGTVFKKDGKWVAELTLGWVTDEKTGKRKRKSTRKVFKTKKEAVNCVSSLADAPTKESPTLDELWNAYLPALKKLSKDKIVAYKIAKRKMDCIFYKHIDELTIAELQEIVDKKAQTHYPARDMKVVLSHLYKLALAQNNMTNNLSKYIVLPELNAKASIPFTDNEIDAFWDLYSSGDSFVAYILLMLNTGMMPGELLIARKDMIDFDNQLLIGGGLKTKKRRNTPIFLPNVIIPVLRSICENSKGEKLIHINKDNFYTEYYRCLERAKVRKLPPYSCRHTTGSILGKMSDIPVWVLREILRHSKSDTTNGYVHIDNKTVIENINKIAKTKNENSQ